MTLPSTRRLRALTLVTIAAVLLHIHPYQHQKTHDPKQRSIEDVKNATYSHHDANETMLSNLVGFARNNLECNNNNQNPTVVTVFDSIYAPLFTHFVSMCSMNGLPRIVGLALSKEAADLARQDLLNAGSTMTHVHVVYEESIES